MKSTALTFGMALFLAFVAYVLAHVAGCTPHAKAVEAEATYLAQQLECVEHYATRPEIDACRAKVRERWGIAETVTDAGKDSP